MTALLDEAAASSCAPCSTRSPPLTAAASTAHRVWSPRDHVSEVSSLLRRLQQLQHAAPSGDGLGRLGGYESRPVARVEALDTLGTSRGHHQGRGRPRRLLRGPRRSVSARGGAAFVIIAGISYASRSTFRIPTRTALAESHDADPRPAQISGLVTFHRALVAS